MSQWNVTQGDNQFVVDGGLAELKNMARRGDLGPGDMLQPPGAADWMYASEVPELQVIFAKNKDIDDEAEASGGLSPVLLAVGGVLALVFVGIVVVGVGVSAWFASQMTEGTGAMIGEGGMTYSQMIVTNAGSGLRGEPSESASIKVPLAKDDVIELLAKRGTFYRARTKSGGEGWIPLAHVLPLYQLGGAEVRDEFDPLYNPDRYVEVSNARWMQLPAENPSPGAELSNTTSRYAMTDLRIVATIKDAQGHELEKVEIPIEGTVDPNSETMVGTLSGEVETGKRKSKKKDPDAPPDRVMTTSTFEELAATDPELQMRWTSGVEVEMKTQEFTNAQIDVVGLRATPEESAKKGKRRP